ncbi:MAG: acyloxyacyl hydrolase [Azospirillaceae bacterium]|nr:acyloxyacyl hydrolase [Azospirillaceae bacterium]
MGLKYVLGVLGTVLCAIPALAQEAPAPAPASAPAWFMPSEIRGGVLAHDAPPISDRTPEKGWDLNLEVLLQPLGAPDSLFIFRPRPMIGGTKNFQGKTDFAYFGLTWEFRPFQDALDIASLSPLFLEPSFGLAFDDGRQHGTLANDQKLLGSVWQFRSAIDIGWHLTETWDISAYIDHISNAGIFNKTNEGLETWGMRVGYNF